jgi:glycosyltransferase involved in cell wall biosynthesis
VPDAPHDPTGRPEITLLTAGRDQPYAFGLATALAATGVRLDVIGGNALDLPDIRALPGLTYFDLREDPGPDAGVLEKAAGILRYYCRLVGYTWNASPKLFHILWNNRFDTVDRVVLMLYYRLLGKRIVLTAHNVNAGARDASDGLLNRCTLKFQYRLCDHIFVHTEKMSKELVSQFSVRPEAVSVIPFGINNAVPHSNLTPREAKRQLGVSEDEKTILFFGNIAPYKGLEYLIGAFREVAGTGGRYRLIVAGRPKGGFERYWEAIKDALADSRISQRVTVTSGFIPDADIEKYFKAADVLALPYTSVSQSGVLFLGYSFGLPVLAADVGSLREDVIEGETGFMVRATDSSDLARAIQQYFSSHLFARLDETRWKIQELSSARNSWTVVASRTCEVYGDLLARARLGRST